MLLDLAMNIQPQASATKKDIDLVRANTVIRASKGSGLNIGESDENFSGSSL